MFRHLLLATLLSACTVEWVDQTATSIQDLGEGNQDGDEARPRQLPRMLGTQEGEPFRGTQEGEPNTDSDDTRFEDSVANDPAASPPESVDTGDTADTGDTGDTDEPQD